MSNLPFLNIRITSNPLMGAFAVFIEGARQSGKTTLAKRLIRDYKAQQYLNYDNLNDREIILSGQSFVQKLAVLDMLAEKTYNSIRRDS